jgi:hypothetical protein
VVDLPFAVPTLVAGVMLVALYGPNSDRRGWFEAHGIHIIFAPLGILLALLFVTLPLVVRSVQPSCSSSIRRRRGRPCPRGRAVDHVLAGDVPRASPGGRGGCVARVREEPR